MLRRKSVLQDSYHGEDLSYVCTTIARDICARRLVDSARAYYPKMKILVADQNEPTEQMAAFYRGRGVEVHWVPFDFGVSAGRSLLARKVVTNFLVFGDDDYVFTGRTRFAPVMAYLKARPDVALVTGTWVDSFPRKDGRVSREPRRYEAYLYRDIRNRGLVAIPIDHIRPEVDSFEGEIFFRSELGLNWAMTRTSLFADERFLWDSQFKTNGEHENFFLQIKEFGGGRVMFYPGMECDHRPEAPPSYMRLRNRDDGWVAFGRKWDVDWFLLVGKIFHQYDDYTGTAVTYAAAGRGASSYLPKRNHDYLRIWANGASTASVSDSVALRDARQREQAAWKTAAKRIDTLRERLKKAEVEKEKTIKINADLRARLNEGQPPMESDGEVGCLNPQLATLGGENRRRQATVARSPAEGPPTSAPDAVSGDGDAERVRDPQLERANEELREKNAELRAKNAVLREVNTRQRVENQKKIQILEELRNRIRSAQGNIFSGSSTQNRES